MFQMCNCRRQFRDVLIAVGVQHSQVGELPKLVGQAAQAIVGEVYFSQFFQLADFRGQLRQQVVAQVQDDQLSECSDFRRQCYQIQFTEIQITATFGALYFFQSQLFRCKVLCHCIRT